MEEAAWMLGWGAAQNAYVARLIAGNFSHTRVLQIRLAGYSLQVPVSEAVWSFMEDALHGMG
jgi:hypothetical protein